MHLETHKVNAFFEPAPLNAADELSHLFGVNVLVFCLALEHSHDRLAIAGLGLENLWGIASTMTHGVVQQDGEGMCPMEHVTHAVLGGGDTCDMSF